MIFPVFQLFIYTSFLFSLLYFHVFLYNTPNRSLINMENNVQNCNLTQVIPNFQGKPNVNNHFSNYEKNNKQEGQENYEQNLFVKRKRIPDDKKVNLLNTYRKYFTGEDLISALQNTFIYEYYLLKKDKKIEMVGYNCPKIVNELKLDYLSSQLKSFDSKNELVIEDKSKIMRTIDNGRVKYFYKNIQAIQSSKPIFFFDNFISLYTIGLKKDRLEALEYFSSQIFYRIQRDFIYDELKNGKLIVGKTMQYTHALYLSKLDEYLNEELHKNGNFYVQPIVMSASEKKIYDIRGMNIFLVAGPHEKNIVKYEIFFQY